MKKEFKKSQLNEFIDVIMEELISLEIKDIYTIEEEINKKLNHIYFDGDNKYFVLTWNNVYDYVLHSSSDLYILGFDVGVEKRIIRLGRLEEG